MEVPVEVAMVVCHQALQAVWEIPQALHPHKETMVVEV
jgi:hypothetical protein